MSSSTICLSPAMALKRPLGGARVDDPPLAVKAQNRRLLLEAAKHQREPAVLREVGGGLILAAGQVQVGHLCGAQYAKGIKPLGGDVDATLRRRGGSEEDVLRGDELPQVIVQFREEFGHAGGLLKWGDSGSGQTVC
jgi:hypothetical protein